MRSITGHKGFTLPELLVVIALIGVLTTFVMVNFQRGERANKLKRAGTEVQQNIRLSQTYSIAGNSVRYCSSASPSDKMFKPCNLDAWCDGGSCITGVPLGGYGVHFDTPTQYVVFGDTYGDPMANHYYDGVGDDYTIIENHLSNEGISVARIKFGEESSFIPSGSNYVDITFEPPTGKVHFYHNETEARNLESQLYTTVQILVQSDFIANICRIITVNRVSGQISEDSGPCTLD